MTFTNPTGCWEHNGGYTVLLTDDVATDRLPSSVFVHNKTIRVEQGLVAQSIGGIQFYADGQPFFWRYQFIVEIHDQDGRLIWRNNNY
jgi:hypothetical protein